jgi:2,3-bisphosphoglycerate-independent phosphoglycerate mutase
MRLLFVFLDGVGLGEDIPSHNPFATARLSTLNSFTNGRRWLGDLPRIESRQAVFIPTDACLGVEGKPQSATGQATIWTGINVPQVLGQHYGPRPNRAIAEIVEREGVMKKLTAEGTDVFFACAFPHEFFEIVRKGKRLLSANQLAVHSAGVKFPDANALGAGQALSADFTGEGWRARFGPDTAPLRSPFEAGQLLAQLATSHVLTFFDHWATDYIGHRGTLEQARRQLEIIDEVMAGILDSWDCSQGLVILTSDHGNIEAIGQRGHTRNPVPTLVIGDAWPLFAEGFSDLSGFAPGILRILNGR